MNTLTIDQCRAMLAAIRSRQTVRSFLTARKVAFDQALFTSLLLCGSRARTWTWGDALGNRTMPAAVSEALRALAVARHWNPAKDMQSHVFTSPLSFGKPISTHDVTRRMKRYARIAGLDQDLISLRTVANTYHEFQFAFASMDDAADLLGLFSSPVRAPRALHGIGRRSAGRGPARGKM